MRCERGKQVQKTQRQRRRERERELLTLCPSPHTLSRRINGEQTRMVRPARNAQTEYDMNMSGACHVNTILRRGA